MKKLLVLPLIILLFLAGCKESETTPTPPTRVIINVRKQQLSASGQLSVSAIPAIIHVWKAEERDFDVNASGQDIYVGYAYDKNSKAFHSSEYGGIGSAMNEEIKPGRYFVYVVLNKSASTGSQAYSYTYFEIKEGERLNLDKTFSYDVGTQAYEVWGKNR